MRDTNQRHIEPFEHEVKIKYRVDGVLVERSPSSKRLQAAIVSRLKIMADMNIAERFVPQDGHIEFAGKNGRIDLRVSTIPTVNGEAIELRILDRSASLMKLHDLGHHNVIEYPYGIECWVAAGNTVEGKEKD